jgi:hypothetical protein
MIPPVVPPKNEVSNIQQISTVDKTSQENIPSKSGPKNEGLFGDFVKNFTKTLGFNEENQQRDVSKDKETQKLGKEMGASTNHEQKPVQQNLPGGWNEPNRSPKVKRAPSINPSDRDQLSNQLQNSVNTVATNSSKNLQTHFPNEKRASEYASKHVTTECSVLTDQDLTLVTVINDISVFVDKRVANEGVAVITSQEDAVLRFSLVLKFLSHVFGLADNIPNIYWDSDGSTIAFNRGRTLFFNLRYYLGWHYKNTNDSDEAKTYHYWFLTFCHELAHNFHGPHDATHEYWMSSFAETYMGKLINALDLYGIKS